MGGKLTQENFIKRVYDIYGDKYTILSDYTNQHNKVLVRHNICGYEWWIDPWSLLRKQIKNCPLCNNKWKRTTDTFKAEVAQLYDNEYEVLGEYKSTNKPILMRHKVCGTEFLRLPREFKKGVRCPKCRRPNYFENTETFQQRLDEKYSGEYELLSDYQYARRKVSVKCKKCGTVWQVTPDNLMRGHGCPHCTISHGEDRIENWLKQKGFNYKAQYSNKSCRDKRALRFDFAILDENNNPVFLIEYDGAHHFTPTRFNNIMSNEQCESNLKDVQRKDAIKKKYCEKNNIPLLRISHRQFNKIEEILEKSIIKDNPVPSRE